jgi:hypothetical protein
MNAEPAPLDCPYGTVLMNDLMGSRVWSLKEKSQLLVLAREEGALPTSIAWLTGEGSQASRCYLGCGVVHWWDVPYLIGEVWRSSLVVCGVTHWCGVTH